MKLVFATNNQHKLQELRQIVGPGYEILGLHDIGCDVDIPETGTTLQENALQKAMYVYQHYGYNCFADDTGLEVDALGGEPGIYSARYAQVYGGEGKGHDAEANTSLLLKKLYGEINREARFRTVIALVQDGSPKYFEGIVEGEIIGEPQGDGGFGYDPVFKPKGWDKTFAQASAQEKNAVSHRGRATQKLIEYLNHA